MFVCSVCTFTTSKQRQWDRHHNQTGHEQELIAESEDEVGSDTEVFEEVMEVDQPMRAEETVDEPDDDFQGEVQFEPDDPDDPEELPPQEPWFPWRSKCHFYLTVLYHGSHRRNMDQQTLRAVMDILRIYVSGEHFPSLDEIVNFRYEYWEAKIFETRIDQENVFSFLKPEGIIAMRLANPVLAKSFDRVPRKNPDGLITSQSSSEKFQSMKFRKLGKLLKGDLVQLSNLGEITMEGFRDKVPCQIYFHIQGFYIEKNTYKVEGKYFFHSSLSECAFLRERVNNDDCFIQIRNMLGDLKFDELKYEQTLRSREEQPIYSQYTYDENTPPVLYLMSDSDLQDLHTSLDISEREGCVNVVTNIHIDDASQVQSKMWKSASVCDIQFAGAPAGVKGNEHNNIILGLYLMS